MAFLSEDPTYLVTVLGLVAAACFMGLRVTQQGKYLYWGLSALGLAGLVVIVEQYWVTDNERIEHVVYDLRRAVLASDVEGVLSHLTHDVEYVQHGSVISGEATRALIRANLEHASFEFLHINDLQTSAGQRTRRGKAEFRVYAKGTLQTSLASYNMGTANSAWSLGFEETGPNVWKVNRISPTSLPQGAISVPMLGPRQGDMGRIRGGIRGDAGNALPRPGRSFRPRGVPFRTESTPSEATSAEAAGDASR